MTSLYTRKYKNEEKRALNIVWTAAGRYDFKPLFLSFNTDGSPDFYFNLIIGLTDKWFNRNTIKNIFSSYSGDIRQEQFDSIIWLALENSVYEKELPQRPVLKSLREEYAKNFLDLEYTMSRQQWMSKNNLTYTLQSARWRYVLNGHLPIMTPWEKELSSELFCSSSMTTDEIAFHIKNILNRYFKFNGTVQKSKALHIHISEKWMPIIKKLSHSRIENEDKLVITRTEEIENDDANNSFHASNKNTMMSFHKNNDLKYIKDCFGPSIYSEKQMSDIEKMLCTGNHQNCHLWFTSGAINSNVSNNSEAKILADAAIEQRTKNRRYFEQNIAIHKSSIMHLSAQIRNSILLSDEPHEIPSKSGQLISSKVWRGIYANDNNIFFTHFNDTPPKIYVDLMLDASASRMYVQEKIASQGYIIAESLTRCGVPVQISSFCSIRGYTVTHILKNMNEQNRNLNIFDYFAAGWNRDGLAIKSAGYLIKNEKCSGKHILIILTDASPNDSFQIPAAEGSYIPHDYSGDAGIQDAAEEVKNLHRAGIQVAAIFTGLNQNVKAAKEIYGNNFTRITSMDKMASAVGNLLQKQFIEMDLL